MSFRVTIETSSDMTSETVTTVHVCQRAKVYGYPDDIDPDFPGEFARNPWCWSEELGFHRANSIGIPVKLHSATGSQVVGPDFISPGQALCLGLGIGTGSNPRPDSYVGEMLLRVTEVLEEDDGNPVDFAFIGLKMREVIESGARELLTDNNDARREWYKRAYFGLDDTSRLGPWKPILDRAAAGCPAPGDPTLAHYLARDECRTHRNVGICSHDNCRLNSFASYAYQNMTTDSPSHSGMRGHALAARYCTVDPAPYMQTFYRLSWVFNTLDLAQQVAKDFSE